MGSHSTPCDRRLGDLVYQQGHFIAFYVAFGLVLWAFDRAEMTGNRTSRVGRLFRSIVWGAFGAATAVATLALLSPDGYRIATRGDVRYVQEPLFFLPLMVAIAVGAAWLPTWFSGHGRLTVRCWLSTVAAFLLLGMLRESDRAAIDQSTDSRSAAGIRAVHRCRPVSLSGGINRIRWGARSRRWKPRRLGRRGCSDA